MSRDERAERATRRRSWPGGLGTLEEPPETPALRGDAGLAAVWAITLDAWALSGREIPDYRRAEMPGRVLRPDDP